MAGVWDCAEDSNVAVRYLQFEPVEDDLRAEIEAQATRVGESVYV